MASTPKLPLCFDTYTLPTHWASALINDEWSGMTYEEQEELMYWLELHKPGACVGVEDNSFFTAYHDAKITGVLPTDCSTFTFQPER